jgi:hypothetical protein
MSLQTLTLHLDGITAGDYLTWCRDPEPVALDCGLRSISIDANPLGDTISAVLDWDGTAPVAGIAAPAAGLPLTADVRTCEGEPCAPLVEAASMTGGDPTQPRALGASIDPSTPFRRWRLPPSPPVAAPSAEDHPLPRIPTH